MVQIAVHVPFDIADGMIAQDGINALEQIFGNFGPRDVENILVAERDVINALDLHRPIGMGAIQIAVGIDHFGFEPDAHFHAEAGDMVNQRLQAIGIHRVGYSPVAESRAVMPPRSEPAIIEHEPLNPKRGGAAGEIFQLLDIMRKPNGFPGIVMHRARLGARRRAQDVRPHMMVEMAAERRQTFRRISGDDAGASIAFTRCQPDFAGQEQRPH